MTELEFIEDFMKNLENLMYRQGISQNRLAEESGISQATISRYLKGERMPTLKAVINICCVLECDIDELVYIDEKIE